MTHFWAEGLPVTITTDRDGLPQTLRWDIQTQQVAVIVNFWRVEAYWWRDPVQRDYYKLVTHHDCLVIVYRDGLTGNWWLQQLYD